MKKLKISQKIDAFGISLLLLSSFYFYEFTYLSLPSFKIIIIELIKIFIILLFFNIIFLHLYDLKFKDFFLFSYLIYVCIFTLKLIFNASDVITLHLFIEKSFNYFIQWDPLFKPISITIISYLIPYLIVTSFLLVFLEKLENIKKFFSILGMIISVIIIIDLFKIYKKETEIDKKTVKIETNKNIEKKVLWILFDALDPEYLSKEINNKKVFKNLNNLKNESVYFNDAYSPGKFTNDSVPAQLMGINILSEKAKHRVKIFTDLDGKKIPFKFENTIFESLNKKGLSVSLISSVLEYCTSYLRSNKWNVCKDTISENKKINIFDDAVNFYLSLLFKFKNYLKVLGFNQSLSENKNIEIKQEIDFKDLNFSKLEKLKFDNSKFFADQFYLTNIRDLNKTLIDTNLLFLHFYIPHLHHENQFLFDTLKIDKIVKQNYFLRYLYVDFFMRELVNEIKKNNQEDILLIVSSDHWWRAKPKSVNDKEYIGNSFFLVKNLKDKSGYSINKKSTNIIIPDLIEKFFDNNLNSNKDFFEYSKNLDVKVHIKKTRFNNK